MNKRYFLQNLFSHQKKKKHFSIETSVLLPFPAMMKPNASASVQVPVKDEEKQVSVKDEEKQVSVTDEEKLADEIKFLKQFAEHIYSVFAQNPGTRGHENDNNMSSIIQQVAFATAALLKHFAELLIRFVSAAETSGIRMSRSTHLWDSFLSELNPSLKEAYTSLRHTFDDLFLRSYQVSSGDTSQICAAAYQTILKPFLSCNKSVDANWIKEAMDAVTNCPRNNAAAREAVLAIVFPQQKLQKNGGEKGKTVSQQLDGFRLLAQALDMFLKMHLVKSVTFKLTGDEHPDQFVLPPYPGQIPNLKYLKKTQRVNELLRRIAAALLRRVLDPNVQDQQTVDFSFVDVDKDDKGSITPIVFNSWHQVIGALNPEAISEANRMMTSDSRVPTQGEDELSKVLENFVRLIKSTFEGLGHHGKVSLSNFDRKLIQAVVGRSDFQFRGSANGTATPLSFTSLSQCFLWMANLGLDDKMVKGLFALESTGFPAAPDSRNSGLLRSPFEAACYVLLLWRWYQRTKEDKSLLSSANEDWAGQVKLVEKWPAAQNKHVLLFLALSVPNLSHALKQFGNIEDEKDESSHYLTSDLLSQLLYRKSPGTTWWPVFLRPIEEVTEEYMNSTLKKCLKLFKQILKMQTTDAKVQGSGVVTAPPKKKRKDKKPKKKRNGKVRNSTNSGFLSLHRADFHSLSLSPSR